MRAPRATGLVKAAAATALLVGVLLPAQAAPPPVGTPTAYGLARNVQQVGSLDLGHRGMNSPVAVAGPCVYVGDRGDHGGIAIVDARNPRKLRKAGTIAPTSGSTQREMRADRGLGILVVMTYSLNGLGDTAGNALKTYDIRDCSHPKLLSTVDFGARPPHEFFLWKDKAHPGRVLAYLTFTLLSPDLVVYDLSDPTAPTLASAYDVGIDQASKASDVLESGSGYLHSIWVNDEGTRAYMGNWDYGFYVTDTSSLAAQSPGVVRPVGAGKLDYDHNVHGAVKVPGRNVAVMVQEDYANAGHGCPFGWLRTADVTDEANPTLLGEFKLPENAPDCSRAKKLNGTFTAHNQTLLPHVALVPWYAGGLRVVDTTDPRHLFETGAFVPRPTGEPERIDSRLYFPGSPQPRWVGAMWSYPVVQDGLIYVVDIDNGLFVLRYTGAHASEVAQAGFVEGNSGPSRYKRTDPLIHRSAAAWAAIDASIAASHGPVVVRPPLPEPDLSRRSKGSFGFLCV